MKKNLYYRLTIKSVPHKIFSLAGYYAGQFGSDPVYYEEEYMLVQEGLEESIVVEWSQLAKIM